MADALTAAARPGRAPETGPLVGCPTPCVPGCEAACQEAQRAVEAALDGQFRPLLNDLLMVLNAVSRNGRVAQTLSGPERAAVDRLTETARQAAEAGQ